MKKLLVIVLVGVLLISSFSFAGNGFVNNRNEKARIYVGEYYSGAFLVMKWSKGWMPMAHQDPGAWLTNHWTWYSDSYSENDYYGYDILNTNNDGNYRMEEFIKMKAVADNKVADLTTAGYYIIWGNIVVIKDKVDIYDNETGELIETIIIDGTEMAHPGLGNLKF